MEKGKKGKYGQISDRLEGFHIYKDPTGGLASGIEGIESGDGTFR